MGPLTRPGNRVERLAQGSNGKRPSSERRATRERLQRALAVLVALRRSESAGARERTAYAQEFGSGAALAAITLADTVLDQALAVAPGTTAEEVLTRTRSLVEVLPGLDRSSRRR
jgi:hypothetical protein